MKCKGFWNMCGCEKCRKADRELEKATPEEKNQAREEAKQAIAKRTGEKHDDA